MALTKIKTQSINDDAITTAKINNNAVTDAKVADDITAGTAATLATARSINGVSFNGSSAITVTAAAGTLTGATLASGVTASSLTSVGTLSSLNTSGNIGLGVTPDTWHSSYDALQGANFSLSTDATAGASKAVTLAYNQYIDSGNAWTYINADEASYYQQYNGAHYFATAGAGSADGDVTNSTKLTIANDGTATFAGTIASGSASNVGIGTAQADANSTEVGQGYINLARDDTADAKQIQFTKNGSVHSYIETTTNALVISSSVQGGNVEFQGYTTTTGNIYTPSDLMLQASGQSDWGVDNNSGSYRVYRSGTGAALTIDTSLNSTFAGNLIINGSSSRQIEFKDGSTSEGAIVFDEIANGLVFKVGGTSGSSKLDALKITSGGEFTMTSGSDMIVNLVSTATNGKEYEIQSTDAGNLTFVRRTGSAAEILRFSGSDDSANFDGDILGNTAGSFRLINGQGSASSPSYAFHSDTNTGMFRAANGVLGFTTFGTERLRITGTGDIWHNNGNTVEHALAGHTNELNISHHWNSGQATIHFCYRMENTYTDFTFYNGAGSGHPDLNAASFDTTSDYRMKKSVANFTDNVCDKIKLLRPITYNWKANTKMNEAKQIGFLAHELQEQLPLAVKGEKDAMSEKDDTLIAPQSIKGEALSSYMMKALQEIITRLEALENA